MFKFDSKNPFAIDPQQASIAGTISAGIKVLTAAAKQQIEGAEQLVLKGEQAGADYDEIEARLKQRAPKSWGRKSPLRPANVPYFRINAVKWDNPQNGNMIFDRYAEDRGDGNGRQLYQFPVIFVSENLDDVLKQTFETRKGRDVLFHRSADGQCMEANVIEKGRRQAGPRGHHVRKVCDPSECEEFAAEQCKHKAELRFMLPDCTGTALFALRFTSIYAAIGIQRTLRDAMTGMGTFAHQLSDDGEPMFWLTKSEQSVSRINWAEGTRESSDQYIIRLDARGFNYTEYLMEMKKRAKAPKLEAPVEGEILPRSEMAIEAGYGLDDDGGNSGALNDLAEALASTEGEKILGSREAVAEVLTKVEDVTVADPVEEKPTQAKKKAPESKPDFVCTRPSDAPVVETPAKPSGRSPELKRARKDIFAAAAEPPMGLTAEQFAEWGKDAYGDQAFESTESIDKIWVVIEASREAGNMDPFDAVQRAIPEPEGLPF